eukprot:TRINITY_DN6329_c0_g1_i1.p1 TRINITY_DN6329_c0_g1~~TRINITY_DN6329_c0_g1_i1.p1  ORF type:complete len:166 (-),score=21.00 TRINITY_DN6329_c0_g1_i1:81-578(-)
MLFVTVLTIVLVANAAESSVSSVKSGHKGSVSGARLGSEGLATSACDKIEVACGIIFDPTDLDGDLQKMETCCEQKGLSARDCRTMMSRIQADFTGSKEKACEEAVDLLQAEEAAESSLLTHEPQSQGLMRKAVHRKAGAGEVDSIGSINNIADGLPKTTRRMKD